MTALKTSLASAVAALAFTTFSPVASEAQDAADAPAQARGPTVTPQRPSISEAARALAAHAKPSPAPGYDMDAAPSEADPLTPSDAPSLAPVAPGIEQTRKPDDAGNSRSSTQTAEADPIASAVREKVGKFSFSKGDNKEDVAGVTAYYGASDSKPLWVSKDGVSLKARDVAAEIGRAGSWGLDAAAFEVPNLSLNAGDTEALANAEIKLSLAALKYARHARGGRLDLAVFGELIDRKPVIFDPKTVLQALAAADAPGAYLQSLHPKFPQFAKLRKALNSSSSNSDVSETIRIPAGPDLKVGDKNTQVALVRQRLKIQASRGADDVFDEELAEAVRRQQQFRGLNATGVVDKKFRAALNETSSQQPDEKRQRIIVNMERWRWMPEDLGNIYVWDSIPEQVTRVFINGKEELREKIVVGRPTTPTPQFTAKMQFVIFHPEWGVPDGIKANEIGPRLRRYSGDDGGFLFFGGGNGGASRFLQAQGLRVSLNGRQVDPDSVDWSNADVKRYTFIQPSGGRNVLGIVKFRFPNKHDVYMHDTPDRGLFSERTRAFSHGCMRTQNPIHLAEVLLAHDKGWSPAKIKEIVDRGALEEVKLTSTIPVHIVYFTMDVGDDGALRTYGDIYGLDSRIASALAGRAVPMNLPQPAAVASDETTADSTEPRRRVSSRDRDVKRERDRDRGREKRFNPFQGLFD